MTKKYEREIRDLLEGMDDYVASGKPRGYRPSNGGKERPPRGSQWLHWRPKAIHWLGATFALAIVGYSLSRTGWAFAPYVSLASFLCLLASLGTSYLQRRVRASAAPTWRGRVIQLPRRRWWQFWVREARPRKRRRD